MSFNIDYPVQQSVTGGMRSTTTPLFSRLRALFSFVPGSRLMRPGYGVDLSPVEQTTHDTLDVLSATLIQARETISGFLPDHLVASVGYERDTQNRRVINVNIILVPRQIAKVEIIEFNFPITDL